MAARLDEMGLNSWSLAYQPSTPAAEIMSKVHDAVTAKGWALFDSLSSASKVYRSLMLDGVAYKFVHIMVTNTHIKTLVYENWNIVSHAGFNLAYQSDADIYSQRIDQSSGGYIFIFVHPQWLILFGRTVDPTGKFIYGSSTGSAWSGCLEITRSNAGETPGEYPRFAWMNGYLFSGYGQSAGAPDVTAEATAVYYHYALPRTRAGTTGEAASKYMLVSNVTVPFANRAARNLLGSCTGYEGVEKFLNQTENALGSGAFPNGVSPFTPADAKPLVITAYAYDLKSGVRGAFCGLKLTSSTNGIMMDIVDIECAGDYSPSVFGANVPHALLGITEATLDRVAIPL
jgi:hypothetical protein